MYLYLSVPFSLFEYITLPLGAANTDKGFKPFVLIVKHRSRGSQQLDEFIDDDADASAVFYESEHLMQSSDWGDVELNGGDGESSTTFSSTARR